jgi:preprotein translocase subunit SecD
MMPLVIVLVAGCARHQNTAADNGFTIEFRLATAAPRPGTVEMVPLNGRRPIWVYPEVVIAGDDIASAERAKDGLGHPAILLEMTDSGAAYLQELGVSHIDKPLALFVDGVLISAPYVESTLSKRMMIIGTPNGIDKDIVKRVVKRINSS